MMSKLFRAHVTAMALTTLVTTAVAQAPAGPETLLNETLEGIQIPDTVACDGEGVCAVAWLEAVESEAGRKDWIYARAMGPQGQLGPQRQLRFNDGPTSVQLVGQASGFVAFWDQNLPPEHGFTSDFQQLSSELTPVAAVQRWQKRPSSFRGHSTALPTEQGFALLWRRYGLAQCGSEGPRCNLDVALSILDTGGSPILPEQVVHEVQGDYTEEVSVLSGGSLARDGQGRMVVAFNRRDPDGSPPSDVMLRQLSPLGLPDGPEIQVSEPPGTFNHEAQVVVGPFGEAIVAWQSFGGDGDLDGIAGRRVDSDGTLMGSQFTINNNSHSAQRQPALAADAHGNFVVVWQSFDPVAQGPLLPFWDVKARLFRADGTPVAEEIFVNQHRVLEQELPKVAFAPNGTFFVTWYSNSQAAEGSREDVYARRFSASPGAELCWFWSNALHCDLGRTGGEPELWRWAGWVGAEAGAVPLLGDFDGDGREDLCAWQAGAFRCDLDHEGRPLEGFASWGLAGDTPLLGDVDGDSRADPCVRRKRRLLCDTARDGGFAELQLALPRPTGTPFLGDVDGDDRDDLCLFEAGLWSCTTWAGGQLRARFGGTADQPALADVDGDGRADFCVFAGGTLHCDLMRDGGAAEFQIELAVPSGGRLLLGNLDGL